MVKEGSRAKGGGRAGGGGRGPGVAVRSGGDEGGGARASGRGGGPGAGMAEGRPRGRGGRAGGGGRMRVVWGAYSDCAPRRRGQFGPVESGGQDWGVKILVRRSPTWPRCSGGRKWRKCGGGTGGGVCVLWKGAVREAGGGESEEWSQGGGGAVGRRKGAEGGSSRVLAYIGAEGAEVDGGCECTWRDPDDREPGGGGARTHGSGRCGPPGPLDDG